MLDKQQSKLFRRLVARLLYLATHTLPVLLEVVSKLTKKQAKPTVGAWLDLIQVVRFVKSFPNEGLRITPSDLVLWLSVDASHLQHVEDARGHSGILAFLGRNLIFASSNCQDLTIIGSMEAEGIALASSMRVLGRARGMLLFQGLPQGVVVVQQEFDDGGG